MLKVLLVKTDGTLEVKEFKTINAIKKAIGVRSGDEWNTMELENYKHPIGIIARDQDSPRLKINKLGVKGNFALIGMEVYRGTNHATYTFSPLTDGQIHDLKRDLDIQTYFDLLKGSKS